MLPPSQINSRAGQQHMAFSPILKCGINYDAHKLTAALIVGYIRLYDRSVKQFFPTAKSPLPINPIENDEML